MITPVRMIPNFWSIGTFNLKRICVNQNLEFSVQNFRSIRKPLDFGSLELEKRCRKISDVNGSKKSLEEMEISHWNLNWIFQFGRARFSLQTSCNQLVTVIPMRLLPSGKLATHASNQIDSRISNQDYSNFLRFLILIQLSEVWISNFEIWLLWTSVTSVMGVWTLHCKVCNLKS